jgi:hypothetical protein
MSHLQPFQPLLYQLKWRRAQVCTGHRALGWPKVLFLPPLSATAAPPVAGAPARTSSHTSVYRGKLGPHGRIQLDLAGSRVTVYFTARCRWQGPRVTGSALIGTYPPDATEPSFEPVSGHVRGGSVTLNSEQPGESTDEARGSPTAHVELHARATSRRVRGTFSLDVAEGPSLFDEPEASEHCTTPSIAFMAALTRARH